MATSSEFITIMCDQLASSDKVQRTTYPCGDQNQIADASSWNTARSQFVIQFMNKVPAKKEWNIARNGVDLDINHAYRMFNGKTHQQAVEMFVQATMLHQEDLMWMPLACFSYYVHAYIEYLRSDAAIDDSGGASCFLSLVGFRLSELDDLDETSRNSIFATVDFIGSNQDRFDADHDIYGSFRSKADALLATRKTNA